MPGYYLHLAACNSQARNNLSFLRGVEAPDILKKYFKLYGIEGAKEKYDSLKTTDMPEFEVLEKRIQEKETYGIPDGLHYGLSSKPDVTFFWESLSTAEKENPFYKGYLWHLLTDLLMYSKLDIDSKFSAFVEKHKNDKNFEELSKGEVKALHSDWDKTNAKVRDTYPDVSLPKEVLELGVVKFIEDDNLHYVDWEVLKENIDFLRGFDPLNENLDSIIAEILKKVDDCNK